MGGGREKENAADQRRCDPHGSEERAVIAATSSGRGLAVPGEPARRFQRGNFGMHSMDRRVTVRSQPPKTHPERQMGDPGSGGAATPEQGKANFIPNVAFLGVFPPLFPAAGKANCIQEGTAAFLGKLWGILDPGPADSSPLGARRG